MCTLTVVAYWQIIVCADADKVKVTAPSVDEKPKAKLASHFSKVQPTEVDPVSDSENSISVEGSSGNWISNVRVMYIICFNCGFLKKLSTFDEVT